MSTMPPYEKPWLSVAQQVKRLEDRGLIVDDREHAGAFLQHANYYCFAGYCVAFERERHEFFPDVKFGDIKNAYCFDITLRDLFNEALEVVEVDLCASVAYYFGGKYGAFGHVEPDNFHEAFDHRVKHSEWLEKLHVEAQRSREPFIQHFKKTYQQFPDLPIWVATNIMTLGSLARMIRGMHKVDRKKIASQYGLSAEVLFALVLHLNYVRNLCAHHSRLWDRRWSIKPKLPTCSEWRGDHYVPNDRLFATLLLMRKLLKRSDGVTSACNQWKDRIEKLLDQPPRVQDSGGMMGLMEDWKNHPVWQ